MFLDHLLWRKPVTCEEGPQAAYGEVEDQGTEASANGQVSDSSWKQVLKFQLSLQMIGAQAEVLMSTSCE